jgi:hypothetical protein
MSKFAKTLEERANRLAGGLDKRDWDASIPSIIQREIGLTLDHISRQQQLHDQQMLGLLRIECYVDTDLMQLERRIPRYIPHHFPEKEKLKKRLFEIDKERRNLMLHLEDKKHTLEDKLLSLINKHQQLDI